MRFVLDGEEQVWRNTSGVSVQDALSSLALELQKSNRMIASALLDGSDFSPEVHGGSDLLSFEVLEVITSSRDDILSHLISSVLDLSGTMREAATEIAAILYAGDRNRASAGIAEWVDAMNALGSGLAQLAALGYRFSDEGPFHPDLETALGSLADAQEADDIIRMADLFAADISSALLTQAQHVEEWRTSIPSGGA